MTEDGGSPVMTDVQTDREQRAREALARVMHDSTTAQREAGMAVLNGGSTYHPTSEAIRAMLAFAQPATDSNAGGVGDNLREAAQAVLDSAERPGSRAEYGIGEEGEIWHDYQEVGQSKLDALAASLASHPIDPAVAEPWTACRIGSCQRHAKCMYSPCRTAPPPAVADAICDQCDPPGSGKECRGGDCHTCGGTGKKCWPEGHPPAVADVAGLVERMRDPMLVMDGACGFRVQEMLNEAADALEARAQVVGDREAIARLLCSQHGGDPDAVASEEHDCWEGALWTAFVGDANAILALLPTYTIEDREWCARVADKMADAASKRLEAGHDDDAAAQFDTATEIAAAIRGQRPCITRALNPVAVEQDEVKS